MPIRLIMFDLDGTIVDSMSYFTEIAREVIHCYFDVEKDKATDMYRQTSGLPFLYQVKKLFGNHPAILQAAEDYENIKRERYFSCPFFPDALAIIPTLHGQGYQICVSSNNHEALVKKKLQPLAAHLDMILGYHEGFLKGKDHFDFIQQKMGLSTKQFMFVGDSLHDAKTAADNQVNFVARLGTFSRDDFERLSLGCPCMASLYELPEVLRRFFCNLSS